MILGKLFFLNKNWQKTRNEWLGYIESLDKSTYQEINKILPAELNSDDINAQLNIIKGENNNNQLKLDSIFRQVSIALMLFYSDKQLEGIQKLKNIKCNNNSNNIVTSFIEWIEFIFSCILAILYDMFLYSIKVIINPLCWFSNAKRIECRKSCNRLNTLIDNYEKNKATDKITKDLSKQISKCISVCKMIEG